MFAASGLTVLGWALFDLQGSFLAVAGWKGLDVWARSYRLENKGGIPERSRIYICHTIYSFRAPGVLKFMKGG